MDDLLAILAWTPGFGITGSMTALNATIIVVMSFIGAGIVTRLTNIQTSWNFSINFVVMLGGCVLFNTFASDLLAPMPNELVASAVTANFGMTVAGFALLFSYRNAN